MSRERPTIVDVARRAGVSKSLVSLVVRGSPRVSEERRRAVTRAARELGYRPNAVARSLVRRSSGVFGCIVSDLHNPFFADVADGIEEAASACGYRALLSAGLLDPRREAGAVETLLQLQAEGLILLGPTLPTADVEDAASHIPVVVVGHRTRAQQADSVCDDDEAGAMAVVDHLVRLGHEHITHIDAGRAGGAAGRRRGYQKAMARHGLSTYVRSVRGAFTVEGGQRAMQRIIDEGELPTAVFVANDFAAFGALEALDAAGLEVPGDISVVGYDDILLARTRRLMLTTVAQPSREMGRTAVDLLVERVAGLRTTSRHVMLAPRLVVRGTTAPPRAR